MMLAHYLKFLARIDAPDTQVTDRELSMLTRYAQGAKVIVEIGCYEGKTTAALARCSKSVYSIDPFPPGRLGICYGEVIAEKHLQRLGLRDNVRLWTGFSWDIAPNFKVPVDLVFIDGDHSYEAITRDWNDWYPKLVKGGIIALHDARIAPHSPYPLGTQQFAAELTLPVLDTVDSLVVYRKP